MNKFVTSESWVCHSTVNPGPFIDGCGVNLGRRCVRANLHVDQRRHMTLSRVLLREDLQPINGDPILSNDKIRKSIERVYARLNIKFPEMGDYGASKTAGHKALLRQDLKGIVPALRKNK